MSKDLPESQPSEEVDLGQLFKIIGNAFNRFFRFIGSILNSLFLAFVWLVFFIKKHFLKIALAGIIGFAYGFIRQKTSDPIYKSSIVIKQNYNTGESLYSILDYYNNLIFEQDSVTLSNILQITNNEVNNITKFEVESILDDSQKLKLYDNYTKELDSVLVLSIDFETFLDMSNEYDYHLQRITLKSKEKSKSKKIFSKIIENVESIGFFKNEQQKDLDELTRKEATIKESLKESDSLQKVYQRVLEMVVDNTTGSQTSVTIDNTEDKSVTKEYELYNSDLVLRRELVTIQRQKENLEHIIEIVSSEQNEGTLDDRQDLLGLSFSQMMYYGLLLAMFVFIVLLSLEFLKYLERYKSKI